MEMEHYLNFTAEDFFWDESFRKWVLNPTEEDESRWAAWLEHHPEKTALVLRAQNLVRAVRPKVDPLPAYERQEAIRSILSSARQPVARHRPNGETGRTIWWVAASVVFLTGIGLLYKTSDNDQTNYTVAANYIPASSASELFNNTGEPQTFQLPDSSTIVLEPLGRISLSPDFNVSNRELTLTGKAFFDIKRNTSLPFLVYAGETITRVLGTQFTIDAKEEAPEIVVSVTSGTVSVFKAVDFDQDKAPDNESGVVLTPNQQVVFLKANAHVSRKLVEMPHLISVPGRSYTFEFDNTPLRDVFKVLSEAYGIDIVYSEPYQDRTLTVSLEDEPLYEKLDIICRTMQLTYRTEDTRIYVEETIQTN